MVIPAEFSLIGSYAFQKTGLKSVTINSASLVINDNAFYSCISLPSITIPGSVKEIGSRAFANCNILNNVNFENSTNTLTYTQTSGTATDGCFYNSPITTVHLGRNINFSNPNAFQQYLFRGNTGLKTLTIGNTVISIPDYTFQGCSGITEITSLNPDPPTIYANTFSGVSKTIPVKVPCVLAYQAAPFWKEFTNFEPFGECPPIPPLFTLNVNSDDTTYGHATSISMKSGAILTSTWSATGFPSVSTTTQFSGKALILANAKANCKFYGWSDGILDPLRIVDITENKTYIAKFVYVPDGIMEMKTVEFSVFPNPSKDKVTVELSENTTGILALFDLNGKVIKNQQINGKTNSMDISSLSAGTYILYLVKDGVASAGVKIMKE